MKNCPARNKYSMDALWKKEDFYCKVCFKKINNVSFYNFMNKDVCLCDSCMNKISAKFRYFKLGNVSGLSVFEYDEELKKLIYEFKGCYDIELERVFLERYIKELRLLYSGYDLIPAPSFEEDDEKRGFNHIIKIFSALNLNFIPCIKKTSPFKQASHKSNERSEVGKHLIIENGKFLKNKKILLVDDVYTTGSTMQAMINLIKPYKPKIIKMLVISKTVLKEQDT